MIPAIPKRLLGTPRSCGLQEGLLEPVHSIPNLTSQAAALLGLEDYSQLLQPYPVSQSTEGTGDNSTSHSHYRLGVFGILRESWGL